MAGRQQWRFERRVFHCGESGFEQVGKAAAAERRLEPAPADQAGYLGADFLARFGRDAFADGIARSVEHPAGKRLRPHFRKPPQRARIGIGQLVDIGIFEPEIGERVQRLAGMHRLSQKDRIDAARARPGQDIGKDAQLQASMVGNMIQKAAIDSRAATRTGPGRIGIAARAGEMPQFLGDAVHVDRQAHPAIADQRNPEFLLTHR